MAQQHSLIISILIAALIIGGSIFYAGGSGGADVALAINTATPYPTPVVQQAAPFAPTAGAGAGCGIPRS